MMQKNGQDNMSDDKSIRVKVIEVLGTHFAKF